MIFVQTIATVFGIGYITKGGGTVAAVAYCLCWFFLPSHSFWIELSATITVIAMGIGCGNLLEKKWGKDSSKIVLDEVAGMMIPLLIVPVQINYVIVSLVLFRFFDIAKPLGIKKLEALPGGWGVMGDDVLAGIYAGLLVLLIFKTNLL
jgi:phosphatidylglycerophosphatase A